VKKQQWRLLGLMLAIPIALNIVGMYRDEGDLFTVGMLLTAGWLIWVRHGNQYGIRYLEKVGKFDFGRDHPKV
jgi:hypothetical protein